MDILFGVLGVVVILLVIFHSVHDYVDGLSNKNDS